MEKYRGMNERLTKMHSPQWVQAVDSLKNLECDNENKDYRVKYRKGKQRTDHSFKFHHVKYVEETKSFIFTLFKETVEDYSLTEEVRSMETLVDIEVITLTIEDKSNWDAYIFE